MLLFIITISVILAFILLVLFYVRLPIFGRLPTGARLQRIQNSPNYKDGAFQNIHHTPALTEGATYSGVMKEFFFKKSKNGTPIDIIPSQSTDLHHLDPAKNILVWFGHSSYFMQIDGKTFLVDPVFSGSASPFSWNTKSFGGANTYSVEDMPNIDYLILTHDHYDHLDYKTVVKLRPKVSKVITSLGVGEHLQRWGFDDSKVIEKNWHEEEQLADGFTINTTPGRHFAGRAFKRNGSLWQSFVLTTPSLRIFIGGDSGYDTHFKEIGEKFGPFDLVMLECGQYNKSWRYIHMMPEEVVQAARDLKAKVLLPVHWAKFKLSLHAWDEPIIRVTTAAKEKNMPIITPMIGQAVDLNEPGTFPRWWDSLK